MDNEHLVQFHSSAESLAGEIAFRNMFRKAGFSEREIDGMILRAYLRKKLFKDWAAIAVFITCVTPFILRPVFGIRIPAATFLIAVAVIIVAVWVLASHRSRVLAQSPEAWVRRKGQTWTGVWVRR